MSKKRIVEQISSGGINYGKISSPDDLMKIQDFAHEYLKSLTTDFLTANAERDISGFDATPTAMNVAISAGHFYYDGSQFDGGTQTFQISAANPSNPRIDIIYATVAADVPANQQMTSYQRLRTEAELNASHAPYLPQQMNVYLEKRNVVTIGIKTGTASATPVQPTLESDEIPLWRVNVPAAATSIVSGNLTDLRRHAANLRAIKTQLDSMLATLGEVQDDVATALAFYLINVNWANVYGENYTANLLNVLADFQQRLLVLRYRYPTIVSGDGRISATGMLHSGTPSIEIPLDQLIQFGDRFVYLQQNNFTNVTASMVLTGGATYEHPALLNMSGLNSSGNKMIVEAPTSTKYLILKRDGTMEWKTTPYPSNATECLLLKSVPDGSNEPKITRYRNLRNGVVAYSGTASATPSSKQFQYDIAYPPGTGYIRAYGVKASDKSMYEIDPLSISDFDQTINVSGVTNGDKWVVEWNVLSAL